ncbi:MULTISPECIES: D-mannonate oxidoreductase [Ensifer]|jgi:tagaturonate reductase|uniref:Mannitol dehydrogenase family protein n=1 Tax=Ensifer canadensis TaxID=555315 RepID=A0AAW4FTN6_9HYPH|nr:MULTISPECIES: D-mannonate oxidoreductase [Ensifer]MDP9632855.1 tagaturonate reductase [Ensifer adhaerens]KQU92687.1 D-mannonate oxidoreductase [Ensifer sp. Root31]KQW50092.1 D-mannonate oxidoreductase [Ensifer sp. Root1252]KQW67617.1 D-mannonate oxidoreductase [Ensifer sp. Root127]KQY62852.1 D-mannonate oxidoreductase [Ensifer sp. Root142]
MKTPFVQFGTSRFLQAHADLFISEALERQEAPGRITVVQTTGSAERSGRLVALTQPDGYPVMIRGLADGKPVDKIERVKSVVRAVSTNDNWDAVCHIVADEAEFLISNTGDTGYDVSGDDLSTYVPLSFPGKLLLLLKARFDAGGKPLTILPCELVSRNGDVLKAIVLELARERLGDPQFVFWLANAIIWANTLVDRIVSEPIEPAGAVAEPYALWAIEKQRGLRAPCAHECVILVDDLTHYEKLKLHILNLGHTVLADIWLRQGRDPDETVRQILADADVARRLEDIYAQEVVPAFAAKGLGRQASAYVATTLDRFRNPFLDHRMGDIANHHTEKIVRRIAELRRWSPEVAMPMLSAICDQ